MFSCPARSLANSKEFAEVRRAGWQDRAFFPIGKKAEELKNRAGRVGSLLEISEGQTVTFIYYYLVTNIKWQSYQQEH
jgi:hypothetical protein